MDSSRKRKYLIISFLFFLAASMQMVSYFYEESDWLQLFAGSMMMVSAILFFLLARGILK